jgi:hypothetical protein
MENTPEQSLFVGIAPSTCIVSLHALPPLAPLGPGGGAIAGASLPSLPLAPSPAIMSHRTKLAVAPSTSTAMLDPPATVASAERTARSYSFAPFAVLSTRSATSSAPPCTVVFCSASALHVPLSQSSPP